MLSKAYQTLQSKLSAKWTFQASLEKFQDFLILKRSEENLMNNSKKKNLLCKIFHA